MAAKNMADLNNKISIAIAFGAMIISIISLCRDCGQDSKLESYVYSKDSYYNPPQLRIDIPIDSLKYQWGFKSKGFESKGDTSVLNIEFEVNIRGVILLTNEGNSTAQLAGEIVADTSTQSPIIREFLLNEYKRDDYFKFLDPTELFIAQSILPNDSVIIYFEHTLKDYISNSKTILHVLILYVNNMGALYDSYYFQEFIFNFPFEEIEIKGTKNNYAPVFKLPDYDVLSPGRKNISLYTLIFPR